MTKKNGNENGSEWRSGFNSDVYTDNGNDDDSVWQGGCNNDVYTKNHDMVTVEKDFFLIGKNDRSQARCFFRGNT